MADAYTRVALSPTDYPQYGYAVYGTNEYGISDNYTRVPKPTS